MSQVTARVFTAVGSRGSGLTDLFLSLRTQGGPKKKTVEAVATQTGQQESVGG